MGIDLSFHSELLEPAKIVKILDKTFEKMVSKSDGLENELCQEFGLKDVEFSTYKTSTSWLKDGEYVQYSRKRTNQEMATYPETELKIRLLDNADTGESSVFNHRLRIAENFILGFITSLLFICALVKFFYGMFYVIVGTA